MVDFVAKFTTKENDDRGLALWMVRMDVSTNQHAGGVEVILQSPEENLTNCAIYLQLPTTNNEVEYQALLAGLDLAKAAGASLVVIHSDS